MYLQRTKDLVNTADNTCIKTWIYSIQNIYQLGEIFCLHIKFVYPLSIESIGCPNIKKVKYTRCVYVCVWEGDRAREREINSFLIFPSFQNVQTSGKLSVDPFLPVSRADLKGDVSWTSLPALSLLKIKYRCSKLEIAVHSLTLRWRKHANGKRIKTGQNVTH